MKNAPAVHASPYVVVHASALTTDAAKWSFATPGPRGKSTVVCTGPELDGTVEELLNCAAAKWIPFARMLKRKARTNIVWKAALVSLFALMGSRYML